MNNPPPTPITVMPLSVVVVIRESVTCQAARSVSQSPAPYKYTEITRCPLDSGKPEINRGIQLMSIVSQNPRKVTF